MADTILERQTFILITDGYEVLYPSDDLYPSDHIFPSDALRIDNIVAGSMSISEILSEATIQLGQMFSTKFECQVYQDDGEDIGDLSGKYIKVFQTENTDYRILFTGKIDSCKIDRLGYDRTIVAYDKAYELSYKNVAEWWTGFWTNRDSASLQDIRYSLLAYMDLPIDTDLVLPNDEAIITAKKTITIKSISFCDMLKMICELQCVFPHFSRNGGLQFIQLNSQSAYNIDSEDYEGENSNFEQYTSEAYTGIQFHTSGGTILYTEGTDDSAYTVADNVLIYGLENTTLHTIGENMLNAIRMLIYRPGNVKMVVSNFNYKLGDYIVTDRGFFYIFKMDFSGSQLVEQNMRAEGQPKQDEVGVDINIVETLIEEVLDTMDTELGDLYDKVDLISEDVDDQLDGLTTDLENTKVTIERGDDYIRSTVAEASGEDIWHIRNYGTPPPGVTQNPGAEEKYNITISYCDYGAPYANIDTVTTSWSSHGITNYTEVDGVPHQEDYDHTLPISDNSDVGRFFMDTNTGAMYMYRIIMNKKKSTKITTKHREASAVFRMDKIADGAVATTDTEWDIFPEGADTGDYYINLEDGKIYLLEGDSSNYHWTYKYDCPRTKAVYETMIEQNSRSIILEASRARGAENSLSSRIEVSAFGITMETEGAGQTAGIRIRVVDENGQPIQGNEGNILLTGLVKFTDLEGTGSTTINGGNIQTNTLAVDTILKNGSVTDEQGTVQQAIEFLSPIKTTQVETGFIRVPLIGSANGMIISGTTTTNILGSTINIGSVNSLTGLPASDVYCKGQFFYPAFEHLTSSSNTANVRCQTTTGANAYRFAPITESSQRWKHDIKPIQDENIDPHKLYDLEVSQFIYNLDYMQPEDARFNTPVPGFIAEKVADVYPIACDRDTQGIPANWNERFIIPPMLKLIQEQNERITALEEQIKQLQGGK